MTNSIFLSILKMNIAASITASAVLPIKYLLQRLGCPKKITFLFWIIIAFRLICPYSINTEFSIFNLRKNINTPAVSEEYIGYVTSHEQFNESNTNNIAGKIWLGGFCTTASFGIISYLILKRKLRFSIKYTDNIYISDNIPDPFVFGIFKPKIYIPNCIENNCYIIAHEKMHIKRRDYIIKPIAFFLVSVNWFNPFNWLLLRLLSNDIELCCDEDVLSLTEKNQKSAYAKSLWQYASQSQKKMIYCLASSFSGNIAKKRIKNILGYKKYSAKGYVLSFATVLLTAAVFCTNAAAVQKSAENIIISPNPIEKAETAAIIQHESTQMPREVATEKPAEKPTEKPAEQAPEKPPEQTPSPQPEKPEQDITKIHPSENGSISITFDMNTDCLMDVILYDSETNEEVLSMMLPSKNGTAQEISDLDPEKTYKISVNPSVGSDWQIEGSYKIN